MFLKGIQNKKETLKFTTIREFGGGLNVVDNDLNLNSKFATLLDNMYRGQDGSMSIRFGTQLFSNLVDVLGEIIGIQYYNAHLIAVDENGVIAAINGAGEYTIIFSEAIANALPGSPSKWDHTTFVCFTEAKGFLKLDNGTNKPLVVDTSLTCQYLVDEATGSNIFVPVARQSSVHDRYLVTSGDPYAPSTLSISDIDTIGTFEGAPPPNDGVNIDLASRVRKGSSTIRGHASFRDKLVVFFDQTILIGTLGIYTGADHTPLFDDAIELWGAKSHNTILPIGDDMLFADLFGVPSLTRALFTGSIKPDRISALIDPLITKQMSRLDDATLEDRTFAVYNIVENQYMLFVPNDSDPNATTETICYAYTIARQSKDRPWSRFRGWNFRSGCRSVGGNVFFTKGSRVYLYGGQQTPIYGDENDYQDTWSDLTTWDDYTGWSVPDDLTQYNETRTGLPIRFDWQFPWADFGKRMVDKFTRFVQVDAFGLSEYNLDMFVDNFVIDQSALGDTFTDGTTFADGSGWLPMAELPYQAQLTTNFVGNDFLGYGGDPYGAIYGGGRPSWEALYQWEAKLRLAKFRIWGDSRNDLRVVSLSVAYAEGSVRR